MPYFSILQPFITEPIVAVLPNTHPLANHTTIPLSMHADEKFLLALKETLPYQISMKAFELSGIEPQVTYHDIEATNLIDLVAKKMGVSLVLKQLALYHSNPQIAVVDITPKVISEIDICYLKGGQLSNAARRFIACAELPRTNKDAR
jgi:DNA-binding transcriptional LysR family regulator